MPKTFQPEKGRLKIPYRIFRRPFDYYCCPPFNEATFTAPLSRLVNIPS